MKPYVLVGLFRQQKMETDHMLKHGHLPKLGQIFYKNSV